MTRFLSFWFALLLALPAIAQMPPSNSVIKHPAATNEFVPVTWFAATAPQFQVDAVVGYRVYWNTSSVGFNWMNDVGDVTKTLLRAPIVPRVWYSVTGYNAMAEPIQGPFSNTNSFSGRAVRYTFINSTTNQVQIATNVSGPFWNDSVLGPLATVIATNAFPWPYSTLFFRLAGTSTNIIAMLGSGTNITLLYAPLTNNVSITKQIIPLP